MPLHSSGIALAQNLAQELNILKNQYQVAIKEDRPFAEVNEILNKIRQLEKELDRLKSQGSI